MKQKTEITRNKIMNMLKHRQKLDSNRPKLLKNAPKKQTHNIHMTVSKTKINPFEP